MHQSSCCSSAVPQGPACSLIRGRQSILKAGQLAERRDSVEVRRVLEH